MNTIDNILDNYFEGTTLPEEESRLKEYFRGNAVLPRHEIYKPLFAAFDKEKQIAAPVFEIPAEKNRKKPFPIRKSWIAAASIAAVTLLLVTLVPFKNKTGTPSGDYTVFIHGKAITNPKKARQYADKMFMQADEIIRTSYEPVVEANAIQTEMDPGRIFDDLSREINHMQSINQ
ncbi:hypothetical protein [Proteiniphilum sp. X52]|uniref:hypothetical protein n=1 Tax=Proteiniphilum sp. X52 TaxID=2382159 RepID=UPI000F0A360B|nr:hypothetical protein [Proteiniphilum sp. X52]RNC63946.1 hypothetical protein D7D25_14015 [Proteiniphilum sp. X52]